MSAARRGPPQLRAAACHTGRVFLDSLAPEGDPLYTHTAEGDDDMPSHVKAALTRTSEQVPFRAGELLLGTWQGLYVWEHREASHRRELVVHVIGD